MTSILITAISIIFLAAVTLAGADTEKMSISRPNIAVNEEALYNLADRLTELLLSVRNVIAINQDLINVCPSSGHYDFKGLTPAVVGTQVGYDFYLRTGIKLKQTSLRIRNPLNAPTEWEKNALERFSSPGYPRGKPYAEIRKINGKDAYCFIKPIYITKACLPCHGPRENIRKDILNYLDAHYPNDKATGYKEGELRGGISIMIPIEE